MSPNLTALNNEIAPAWVDDPNNRGTWSILYSCVFTLVLCVWTAIHLNVPGQGETQFQQSLRKMKWVFAAILVPELGAFTAWQQWWRAGELCADLERIALNHDDNQGAKEKTSLRERKFSLTYGFFVVMGGLVVDVSDIHNSVSRATLTPAAILSLAEKGHFIEISDQDIQDKSKADILAKGLVILQVTWMCLQCISRKVSGYPLTALEIHTLVHAACALIMFSMWFRKPLDVRAPTLVTNGKLNDLIALFLMRSPAMADTQYDLLDPPKGYVPSPSPSDYVWPYSILLRERRSEASHLLFHAEARQVNNASQSMEMDVPGESGNSQDTFVVRDDDRTRVVQSRHYPARLLCHHSNELNVVCTLLSGQFSSTGIGLSVLLTGRSKDDFRMGARQEIRKSRYSDRLSRLMSLSLSRASDDSFQARKDSVDIPDPVGRLISEKMAQSKYIQHWHMIELALSQNDVRRWSRAGNALQWERSLRQERDNDEAITRDKITNVEITGDSGTEIEDKNDLLCSRAQNFRGLDVLRLLFRNSAAGYYITGIMILLSSLYGGIHLSLWNYDFPTRTESLLWKISAITLGSLPGFLLAAMAIGFAFIPFILIGIIFESFFKRLGLRIASLRRKSENFDDPERQYSGLMAFEAKEGRYPSLASGALSWLKQDWVDLVFWALMAPIWLVSVAFCFAISAIPVLYALSRIYIVVESFISLRHVPIGVYVGVGWSKYVPHL